MAWCDRGAIGHTWLPELAKEGVPIVNCGRDWGAEDGIATVSVDAGSVLDLVVAHCAKLSIPRLKFFGLDLPDSEARAFMVNALAERAAPFEIETGFLGLKGAPPRESIARLLNPEDEEGFGNNLLREKLPLAIFCEDDYYGRFACSVAASVGIQVPDGLAVLAAGDNVIGRLGNPTLTTIRLPGFEVGRRAFSILAAAWSARWDASQHRVSFPASELVVRESTGGKGCDPILESVRRRIEVHALTGITFQEVCAELGSPPKALRRRYVEVYGESPSERIKKIRLAEAEDRLRRSDESMAEIAAACGFSSQAAFYNFFIRHTGTSPSEFRENG